MLAESLSITFRALGTNKLRTALTILGITIGISGVISILTIGKNAKTILTSSLNQQAGTFTIFREEWTRKRGKWKRNTSSEYLTMDDLNAIREGCSAVESVIPTDGLGRKEIQKQIDVQEYKILFSSREFKKTRVEYFVEQEFEIDETIPA